jgi:hypothetical protein
VVTGGWAHNWALALPLAIVCAASFIAKAISERPRLAA